MKQLLPKVLHNCNLQNWRSTKRTNSRAGYQPLDQVLQKQWDHAANKHLGLAPVKSHSTKKTWWLCDQNPDGHLRSWAWELAARCPQCKGHKVGKHNSLASNCPPIAANWHATSNAYNPEHATAQGHRLAV